MRPSRAFALTRGRHGCAGARPAGDVHRPAPGGIDALDYNDRGGAGGAKPAILDMYRRSLRSAMAAAGPWGRWTSIVDDVAGGRAGLSNLGFFACSFVRLRIAQTGPAAGDVVQMDVQRPQGPAAAMAERSDRRYMSRMAGLAPPAPPRSL